MLALAPYKDENEPGQFSKVLYEFERFRAIESILNLPILA
jgi:hypothetical protein